MSLVAFEPVLAFAAAGATPIFTAAQGKPITIRAWGALRFTFLASVDVVLTLTKTYPTGEVAAGLVNGGIALSANVWASIVLDAPRGCLVDFEISAPATVFIEAANARGGIV